MPGDKRCGGEGDTAPTKPVSSLSSRRPVEPFREVPDRLHVPTPATDSTDADARQRRNEARRDSGTREGERGYEGGGGTGRARVRRDVRFGWESRWAVKSRMRSRSREPMRSARTKTASPCVGCRRCGCSKAVEDMWDDAAGGRSASIHHLGRAQGRRRGPACARRRAPRSRTTTRSRSLGPHHVHVTAFASRVAVIECSCQASHPSHARARG